MEIRAGTGSLQRDPLASQARENEAMRKAATAFEAAYLAEMLKHSGVNAMPDAFGGGAGEDAFSGLLTQEQARLLAERGGIGLAEKIFEAIKTRSGGE